MTSWEDELRVQLTATFRAEADDRLNQVEAALLALEGGERTRDDVLAEVFRHAHTLKGGSGSIGLTEVTAAAHELEERLATIRGDAAAPLDVGALLASFDALGQAIGVRAGAPEAAAEPIAVASVGSGAAPAAEPPPTAEPREPATGAGAPEARMRVSLARIDRLVDEIGALRAGYDRTAHQAAELGDVLEEIAQRARVPGPERQHWAEVHAQLRGTRLGLDSAQRGLGGLVDDLADSVRSLRLIPAGSVLAAMPRVARDVARGLGKQVRLDLVGREVEADRSVFEALVGPLTHLVRNAVDHGLESPEGRAAAGKDEMGIVMIDVRLDSGLVVVTVSDDGGGIDRAQVLATAVRRGLIDPADAASLDDAAVQDLLFQPGFSTREHATEVSGRGVGLDAVRASIEGLGGTVAVVPTAVGTSIRLLAPTSLASARALLVSSRGAVVAVPTAGVVRLVAVRPGDIDLAAGVRTARTPLGPIAVAELDDLLDLVTNEDDRAASTNHRERRTLVVVALGERQVGVLVDAVVGEEEVVLRALPWPMVEVPMVRSAAVLADGTPVLVLSAGDLGRSALTAASRATTRVRQAVEAPAANVVLVADDSPTTRSMMTTILRVAGYEVVPVGDGVEALDVLTRRTVDAIVTDVEMPRLDGLGLCARVRADERHRFTPIVVVSSLGDEADRRAGLEAGADAYVVKAEFDQGDLVEALHRLIGP